MSSDLSAQPTGGDLRHSVLADLTTNYFSVWNSKDSVKVGDLFTDTGSLRDWDVEVHGAKEVGDANGKIFTAVPNIKIEVLGMVVDITTNTVAAEILVHINDDAKTVLKVTDVFEYEPVSKKIKALRAYKG